LEVKNLIKISGDEEELPDLEDPEYEKAATKIQAGFRGSQARKEVGALRQQKVDIEDDEDEDEDQKKAIQIQMPTQDEPELEEEEEEHIEETEEVIDIDLDDPEVNMAATKIQAGFKGHQTRKEMKQRNDKSESEVPKDSAEGNKDTDKEVIDIDLGDPEVVDAATKIQAGYKGHKTRKEMKETKNQREEEELSKVPAIPEDDETIDEAATMIQSGFQELRAKAVIVIDDAATTIQEGYKGYVARTSVQYDDGIDIDLDDPEVHDAATKIQAGYKGSQARKEVQKIKDERAKNDKTMTEEVTEEEVIDIDFEDPDVNEAATKIQAGFKGSQARKEVQKMKEDKEKKTEEAVEIVVNQKEKDTEEIDIDLNDPEVEQAATKIQAGFKGHQNRKEMRSKKDEQDQGIKVEEKIIEEEEIDIDLTDPEFEAAASKIQAGYKGHQVRKEIGKKKEEGELKKPDQKETKDLEKQEKETQEEEIDIDLNDPEVEQAATKIQAGFKGHQTRKEMKKKKEGENQEEQIQDEEKKGQKEAEEEVIDIDLNDPEVEQAATKIQAGFKGHQVRKELKQKKDGDNQEELADQEMGQEDPVVNPDKEIDIDLNDPEVANAATKIQAGFKGHQTRKEMKKRKEGDQDNHKEPEKEGQDDQDKEEKDTQEEEIDIDLNDPEVAHAATKIQAGFKGHQTRKEMKKRKEGDQDDQDKEQKDTQEEEIDIDMNDPEVAHAATKIQAGFKGHQTRKEMKKKKEGDQDADKEVQDEGEADQDKEEKDTQEGQANQEKGQEDQVNNPDEEIDIDLNDPEVANAATKIQAGFKGHQTRKEMKKRKEGDQDADKEAEKEGQAHQDKEEKDTQVEEIDIDLNDPEVEQAATKIQAGFKGHQTRKEMKKKKKKADGDEPIDMDEKPEEVKISESDEIDPESKAAEAEEIDIDLNDPEVAQAATKIQAGFKGHQTRKEMKKKKEEGDEISDTKVKISEEEVAAEKEEIDIDMNDPEVEQAATKIQASFKGHQTRKEMKQKKEDSSKGTDGEAPETTTDELETSPKEAVKEEEIDIDLKDPEVEQAATKIQASYKGHQTRKEMKQKKEESTLGSKCEVLESKDEQADSPKEASNPENAKKGEKEEVIDIDLNDPDVEMAATKIQAGFKGHQTRKDLKQQKQEAVEILSEDCEAGEPEKTVETEEIEIDLNDPDVEQAATKIQAGFKGHQTRKEMKEKKNEATPAETDTIEKEEDTAIDIDLDDPDVDMAATKIQASFKGHQTRKELQKKKEDQGTEEEGAAGNAPVEGVEEDIDIDLTDPNVEIAATKIQAGFKGHKTRKELKANKSEGQEEEEISTEMLIKGAANVEQDEDVHEPQSHAEDDGYNSPEFTIATTASSVQGSPVKSLVNLELTGTAAQLHDPDILMTIVSQESVTDSDMVDASSDLTQTTEERNITLALTAQMLDDLDEEAGSMPSSILTVANADEFNAFPEEDDFQEDVQMKVEEVNAGHQTSQEPSEPVDTFEISRPDLEAPVDDDESIFKEIQAAHQADLQQQDTNEVAGVVGAVPFEYHTSHPQVVIPDSSKDDVIEDFSKVPVQEPQKHHLMLYYSKGSYSSEKVLIYMYERGIEFSCFNVNLTKGEQFSKWYLKINPKGEVPALAIKDSSLDTTNPMSIRVIIDSTRIIHCLESKYSDMETPALVPSTSNTALYQLHVYFTALFDQVCSISIYIY
jgi:hypothetical protein